LSGLGGALRAPLGPVAAALVPRFALLPAPTPRMMGLRPPSALLAPKRSPTQRIDMFRIAVGRWRHGSSWPWTVFRAWNLSAHPYRHGRCSDCGQHVRGGWGREGAAQRGTSGASDWPQGGRRPP